MHSCKDTHTVPYSLDNRCDCCSTVQELAKTGCFNLIGAVVERLPVKGFDQKSLKDARQIPRIRVTLADARGHHGNPSQVTYTCRV